MTTVPAPVIVVDYDPAWPEQFEALRVRLAVALGDLALAIEHVGSTAVPGLAAKPVIDIDAVIEHRDDLGPAVARLASIGYRHQGDLGIRGREAFASPEGSFPHHLYVCDRGNDALREHLLLRDYLRSNSNAAHEYGALKRLLAEEYGNDRSAYTEAKTDWIERCLADALIENMHGDWR